MLPAIHTHRTGYPDPRSTGRSLRAHWQALWLLPLAGCALVAAAQPAPRRGGPAITGSVISLQGQTLQVDTRANGPVTLTLGPQANIIDQEPATLSDVKAGRFIGTTAVQRADGKLHATEIHIFPESMRGAGEGHYPMGAPNTTMTNGNIEAVTGSVTRSASGHAGMLTLQVSYKGGQSRIVVPPNVTVTMMQPGSPALLQPGANVTVLARSSPTGLLANAIIVHGRAGN
jgi:hypothetical protein